MQVVFFILFTCAQVFTKRDFIHSIIRLKTVKDVLPNLNVYIHRDPIGVTRVHFAQLVVYGQIFIWKEAHVYYGLVGLSPLCIKHQGFPVQSAVPIVHSLFHSPNAVWQVILIVSIARGGRHGTSTYNPLKEILLRLFWRWGRSCIRCVCVLLSKS